MFYKYTERTNRINKIIEKYSKKPKKLLTYSDNRVNQIISDKTKIFSSIDNLNNKKINNNMQSNKLELESYRDNLSKQIKRENRRNVYLNKSLPEYEINLKLSIGHIINEGKFMENIYTSNFKHLKEMSNNYNIRK